MVVNEGQLASDQFTTHPPIERTARMTIEIVQPDIISVENFVPTDIPNVFTNPDDGSVVVIGEYSALKVQP